MRYSELGEYAVRCIEKIPEINDNVFVPESVVMPNHVHMIIIMDSPQEWPDDFQQMQLPPCDPTITPMANDTSNGGAVEIPCYDSRWEINEEMQRRANCCGRLSRIIGQYKSIVTKYANLHEIPFMWQSRFYDHIIRNTNEMNLISNYIQNNPMKWELDRFYSKR